MGGHERFAGKNLVWLVRRNPSARSEEQIVYLRAPIRPDGNEPRAGRLVELLEVERDVGGDPGLYRRHSGDRGDLSTDLQRCTLE